MGDSIPSDPERPADGEVTLLIRRLRQGDPAALDQLVPLLYGELRRLASERLRREWGGRTLATTELVHESYLRLLQQHSIKAEDRADFFAVASNTMRRVLVDAARSRRSEKRGGDRTRVPIDELEPFLSEEEAEDMLLLDLAIDRLEKLNPRAALAVQHRYFGGLTLEESAEILGVSTKTVRRDWLTARAWLRLEMTSG